MASAALRAAASQRQRPSARCALRCWQQLVRGSLLLIWCARYARSNRTSIPQPTTASLATRRSPLTECDCSLPQVCPRSSDARPPCRASSQQCEKGLLDDRLRQERCLPPPPRWNAVQPQEASFRVPRRSAAPVKSACAGLAGCIGKPWEASAWSAAALENAEVRSSHALS